MSDCTGFRSHGFPTPCLLQILSELLPYGADHRWRKRTLTKLGIGVGLLRCLFWCDCPQVLVVRVLLMPERNPLMGFVGAVR